MFVSFRGTLHHVFKKGKNEKSKQTTERRSIKVQTILHQGFDDKTDVFFLRGSIASVSGQ